MRTLLVIVIAALMGFGQTQAKSMAASQSAPTGILEKLKSGPTLNFTIEKATVEEAFIRLLTLAKMPGGIILRSGRSSTSYDFDIKEMHIGEALDYVAKYDNAYAWSVDHDAVLLYPKENYPKLLETRIDHFKAGPSSVDGLATLLAGTLPVKLAESKLKRRPGVFLGGIYNPNPHRISIELHDVTLAEGLDAIAARQGTAIWQYGEDETTGEYYLRFASH